MLMFSLLADGWGSAVLVTRGEKGLAVVTVEEDGAASAAVVFLSSVALFAFSTAPAMRARHVGSSGE